MADMDNVPDDFATLFVTNLPPVEVCDSLPGSCCFVRRFAVLPGGSARDIRRLWNYSQSAYSSSER